MEGLESRYLMTSLGQAGEPAPIELKGYEGQDYFVADSFSFAETGDHFVAEGETDADSVTYRPTRITPKPSVQDVQSAVVVGPAGEELYPDNYGRVKVQFPSDREGGADEKSSCWIRVSQVHAGKGFGGIDIPRIGEEVIVDFVEGDPDRPIIIGHVYHAENMPPFELPGGKNISGMKTNSTKGGGGYNEYVLDDTKGNELIHEHGQFDKDSTIVNELHEHVLHDRSRDVTNNETIEIVVDRKRNVGNNETISIGNDRTKDVGNNETLSVGSDQTRTVGKNETVTITLTRTHSVGVNEMINVGAAQHVTVGAAVKTPAAV
jgi:type VI secretion system secreted protein VgrG